MRDGEGQSHNEQTHLPRQAILDLSNIIKYEFHYKYIKPKYGMNLWLCYIDTDSLVYDIKTDDFHEDITGDVKSRFDMSNYNHSRVHPLPIGVNKKVIGFMTDELSRRIITKFAALRLKLYAFKMLSGSRDKKCKEVKKCVMKKRLDFKNYRQCLLAGWNTFRKLLLFWNKLHEVHIIEVNKLA